MGGEGDGNTRYYYATIAQCRHVSQIGCITDEAWIQLKEEEHMRDHIIQFYQQLLGTKRDRVNINHQVIQRGRLLTEQEGQDLVTPVTNDEIKTALWSIAPSKMPGPDGYSCGFFCAAWEIIGESVCLAIKEFFHSG